MVTLNKTSRTRIKLHDARITTFNASLKIFIED